MHSNQRRIFLKHANEPTANGLEVTLEQAVGSLVLRLQGRIDIDSSPDLRDRLLELLERQSSKAITVDLAEVPYIDPSGIATFIEALKVSRRNNVTFCLQGLTGSVRHLFEVTGVLNLFEAGSCPTRSFGSKVS
jgi:anti-sigma B factor antagonist